MTSQTSAIDKPVVLLRPAPQRIERIFSDDALRRLHERYTVIDGQVDPSEEAIESCLPDVLAIVGQPDLPADRLARAPTPASRPQRRGQLLPERRLRGGLRPGVNVAVCAPVYAQPVAEHALGMAIDLARGISREDRAFREGRERYVSAGNDDAILLRGAEMGLIGYGNIGRRLLPLLAAFRPARIRCTDPWLPDSVIRDAGMEPATLDETLATSTFLFILATVTEESRHLLNAANMRLIPAGARVVLSSRAAVVDFEALVANVAAGRFLCAVDVWPEEPAPPDHPARRLEGMVLSAHRAGGIPSAFYEIGEMVLDDLELAARGLPPVRNQLASRELVARYRSRPVG